MALVALARLTLSPQTLESVQWAEVRAGNLSLRRVLERADGAAQMAREVKRLASRKAGLPSGIGVRIKGRAGSLGAQEAAVVAEVLLLASWSHGVTALMTLALREGVEVMEAALEKLAREVSGEEAPLASLSSM